MFPHKIYTLLLVFGIASFIGAQDKWVKEEIQFPSETQPVVPIPNDSIVIKKSQYYVIKSDTELVADWYGDGDINVLLRDGKKKPLTIPTEWAIGWKASKDDPEFITFNESNLCIVRGSKSGNVTLKIIPAVNKTSKDKNGNLLQIPLKRSDIINKSLIVDMGDTPNPPKPKPKPEPPEPALDDAPVNTNGLYVVFILESGKGVLQTQYDILYGKDSTTWLNKNCESINNSTQWRIIYNNTNTTIEPWSSILKRKQTSYPWLVIISNKKYSYEGILSSASTDEFIKLVSKYK